MVVLTDLIQGVPQVMVNISGLTSGDTSELEVSYTHGYHSQRLLSWEQFKCNGVRSRGSTRVIITLPVVNQIANRAVICCCDKCVVRSNCKRAFFYEKYADMHFVTPLLLSKNIGNDILDDGSPTDVCSPVFTRVHPCSPKPAKKVSFPSTNRRAECQVQ